MTTLHNRIGLFASSLAWGFAGGAGAVEHWFFPAPPDPDVMAKPRVSEIDPKTATFGSCGNIGNLEVTRKPGHPDHG